MRVAVDAMGGDRAPAAPIEGALLALESDQALELVLVGPEEDLETELRRQDAAQLTSRLQIMGADEVILSSEPPVRAFRCKRNSSMRVAMELVKQDEADGMVSCGNTGALMSGGLLLLGRINGVHRPAIATVLPTFSGNDFLMLDLGAHMETEERNLVQHAVMGSIYAQQILGVEQPRIGLLNVGEEATKGTKAYRGAHEQLHRLPLRFVGNIEGRVLFSELADVIVCDGFVGNVILKVIEAVGLNIFELVKRELAGDLRSKLGAMLARPAFRRVYTELNYQEYGGAQLLGLCKPVVKCHGSAEPKAIKAGILTAVELRRQGVADLIESELAKYEEGETIDK